MTNIKKLHTSTLTTSELALISEGLFSKAAKKNAVSNLLGKCVGDNQLLQ